jgi:hypothetical protein
MPASAPTTAPTSGKKASISASGALAAPAGSAEKYENAARALFARLTAR